MAARVRVCVWVGGGGHVSHELGACMTGGGAGMTRGGEA